MSGATDIDRRPQHSAGVPKDPYAHNDAITVRESIARNAADFAVTTDPGAAKRQ